jgi:hypothetical protein
MNHEMIEYSSKTIELAENEQYLELVNRVCYYDAPNLNGVELPSEGAEEKAQTLVNMPVVAKYTQNTQGQPTFMGHEVSVDDDGNVVFGTDTIGTHTEAWIAEDDVTIGNETKRLPCLFAKYRIWARNKNVVAAVKRLYSENKLYSSWELSSLAYNFSNGIKTITDYLFEGNALLGYEYALPAYGVDNAKAISLATEEDRGLMLAEAFARDLISEKEDGDKTMFNNTNEAVVENQTVEATVVEETPEVVAEPETVAEQTVEPVVDDTATTGDNTAEQTTVENEPETSNEEPATEEPVVSNENEQPEVAEEPDANVSTPDVSALTMSDLRRKLEKACHEKVRGCGDLWISFLFPEDHAAWAECWPRESELDYLLFNYEVSGDEVIVNEPIPVKLTVALPQVNDMIAEKNEALSQASVKIQELTAEVETLKPFKAQADALQEEQAKAEHEAAEQELLKFAQSSKQFTEEELSGDEFQQFIHNLDKAAIQAMIADRLVASFQATPATETPAKEPEVAETKRNLMDDSEDNHIANAHSIMKNFFGRK